ncbi:hypothetical protein WJX72_010966 [[Myrmecia] bisecta]|uniref:Transcriptional regulator n=1 Tax=[Myrmecia] bisecta TaxID=41462 RepID=A0AAW1Q857_9CHLO
MALSRLSGDGGASQDDDAVPLPLGDWREFRASLVDKEVAESQPEGAPSGVWASRICQENLHLLQQQDRKLAQEGIWAHATQLPETGGLVISTHKVVGLTNDPRYWQLVIILLEHGQRGSTGLILNRPSSATVGDLLGWGYLQTEGTASKVQSAFQENCVYLGGFYAPNVIARQAVRVLHGHKHLNGCQELVPGIYRGGELAAADEILGGKLRAQDFRFFAGAVRWGPGQLQQELATGFWYTAACSRSIVLKQCLQLPVPLWQEVLELMGSEYSRRRR